MKASATACLLLFTAFISGCSNALLFNNGLFAHTVEPLTFNREPTEVLRSAKAAEGDINQFQYPLSSALSVRVGTNGLGDVAKEHGIKTIYYADIEKWSFLFGLWSRDVVHIYGR